LGSVLGNDSLRIDGLVVARDFRKHVYAEFDRLWAATGVPRWSKPLHTLRKSCIDDWARVAPPNVVMEWATHTSLAATMKYYAKVHRATEQRRAVLAVVSQGATSPSSG
jgi:integrase